MPDHDVECQSVVIGSHPSEAKIAIAQGSHLITYSDGDIVTIETAHTAIIRAVAFSLDGAVIASVADDKILNIADANSGQLLAKHTFDKKLTSVWFADRNVVVGDRFGVVYQVENFTSKDAVVTESLGHIETITALCILPSTIISADIDSKIRCSAWLRTYNIESFCFGHRGAITALCPVGSSTFISAGEDSTVRLWDASSGRQLALFECPDSTPILAVGFDAKTSMVAFIASGSRAVYSFSVAANAFGEVAVIPLDWQPIALGFAASRLFIASATSICSLVLNESGTLVLEAMSHSIANEHMAKIAESSTEVPFVFDGISRKKETERRQEKRAKIARENNSRETVDGSVSD